MRRTAVLALLALAALGHADRLITVPTGRKIPYETVRYEFRGEPRSVGQREHLFGIGIGTSFDTEIRLNQEPGEPTLGTFDFSYNYISPIAGLIPGLSAGVQDALDRTRDGRRFFAAATFRQQFSTINGDFPADITLGLFAARHWSPYVGVMIPFSLEFHLLAEHNGNRIAAGFEYRPIPSLNLRFQVIGDRPMLGAQLTTRF